MSEWIHYMSITKYKINTKNGQVVHVSGFTKQIGADKSFAGRKPAKKVEVETSVVEEETI